MNEIVFTEKQQFRNGWILIPIFLINAYLVFMLAEQLISTDRVDWAIFIPTGAFLFVSLFMLILRLQTVIKTDGIYVQFFPFHWKFKKYTWDEIDKLQVRKYNPLVEYGGWGLRYGFKGWAYNLYGTKGIQLVLKKGTKILIGTQKPDEVKALLTKIGHELDSETIISNLAD